MYPESSIPESLRNPRPIELNSTLAPPEPELPTLTGEEVSAAFGYRPEAQIQRDRSMLQDVAGEPQIERGGMFPAPGQEMPHLTRGVVPEDIARPDGPVERSRIQWPGILNGTEGEE
jgi:hypothetical protein